MAKQVIPEELDLLIQEYLTDGIITEKERKVLLRKAQSLGLDVDEIDLYIDAQQQKADQVIDAAVKKQRGQSCPFCGGSVPQLVDKCPHCGQTITVEASEEMKEIIENLEDALVDFKSGQDFSRSKAKVEKHMRKAQLYYSNNPKIKILIEQVNEELHEIDKKFRFQSRKKWITGNMLYIVFGIIIVVEIIAAVVAKSNATSHLSDYNNDIGSRADTYDLYLSSRDNFLLLIFAIIATVVVFLIILKNKQSNKKK